MTEPIKPKQISTTSKASLSQTNASKIHNIVEKIVDAINKLDGMGLQAYPIQDLVEDTETLGKKLVNEGLKTNQIRKFLDATKRLKSQLNKKPEASFDVIKDDLVFLHVQLAYAAARERKNDKNLGSVAPFKEVLDAAIKQVKNPKDFDKFVQLVEAIVAYHKAAGGKNQ